MLLFGSAFALILTWPFTFAGRFFLFSTSLGREVIIGCFWVRYGKRISQAQLLRHGTQVTAQLFQLFQIAFNAISIVTAEHGNFLKGKGILKTAFVQLIAVKIFGEERAAQQLFDRIVGDTRLKDGGSGPFQAMRFVNDVDLGRG